MTYLKRLIDFKIQARLKNKRWLLIEGPKFSGKTRTCQEFVNSEINLSSDKNFFQLVYNNRSIALSGAYPRFIDEWQNCPFLWEDIKILIDTNEKVVFLLSGSSTPDNDWDMHDGAGRVSTIEMENFTLQECGKTFNTVSIQSLFEEGNILKESGEFNMVDHENEQKINMELLCKSGFFNYYNNTEEECQIELNDYLKQIYKSRRKSDKKSFYSYSYAIMKDVFCELSRLTGQNFNIAAISADIKIDVKTVKRYIDILERMFILRKLNVFKTHVCSSARLIVSPKLYIFDPALAIAALGTDSQELLTKNCCFIKGRRSNIFDSGFFFESQVIKHLRIYSQLLGGELTYYRDVNGNEIDAILKYKNKYAAFEIKFGSLTSINDGIKQLTKFRALLSPSMLEKFVSFNIISGSNMTYRDKKENINIISFRQLFLDIEKM